MRALFIAASLLVVAGCTSMVQDAYYGTMEKFGIEKREILVDRVEEAKESQQEAQQQFKSALEEFSTLINFDGGELQKAYEQLNDQYEASQASADNVTKRIDKVEDVAQALFREWREELDKYSKESLRRNSERQLKDTERRFDKLVKSMRRAETKMAPVLNSMQDNVLYLKHNLNAAAVGALQGEFNNIKKDIDQLIKEMNTAIEQSNSFIDSMKKQG